MQIQGGVFIITGGASGLGKATAQLLVENGAKVVLADLNQELGIQAEKDLGANAKFIVADITTEEGGQSIIAKALEFGKISGLINCAGVAPGEKIVGRKGVHKLETFTKTVQINLIGSFNMLRLAAQQMVDNEANDKGERGVVINVASVAAYEGQVGQSGYSASKGGIVALTITAARELAPNGIRVMTIAPGIMETPMLLGMPQNVQDALGAMVPFPSRLGKPSEFASLAQQIIENSYLNGEVIRLDGAIRMQPK